MRWRLFEGVAEADLQRIVGVSKRRRFSRGEVVIHRDDPGVRIAVQRDASRSRLRRDLGTKKRPATRTYRSTRKGRWSGGDALGPLAD
jgi:hypothetical protein